MKIYRILITVLLAFAIGGCGNATLTPTGEGAMLDVYTSVAMTLAAQSTPTLASTPTLFVTPTSFPSVTVLPTATSRLYPTAANQCYTSTYISDVTIADGTKIAPNESFTKTWELKNTGTCEWEDDYLLIFYSGEKMNGENTAIGESVASGSVVEVSVTLTAPDTDGTYTGYWSLANSSGAAFGSTFYVQIVVSSDLTTSTPTPTDSSTSTSTPTTAPSSTPSPIPSETPTPTPVSVLPNLAPKVGRVGTKISEG